MTILTQETYAAALLADAVYVNFTAAAVGMNSAAFRAQLEARAPPELAQYIASNFDLVHFARDERSPIDGASAAMAGLLSRTSVKVTSALLCPTLVPCLY